MTLDDFRKNFPPNSTVPQPLVKLFEYANQVADWYSGYFELTARGWDDTLVWFDGDKEAACQFVPFGEGPDGSSYCIWMYDGKRV